MSGSRPLAQRRRQRGQTLAEFALILPVFLALLLGVVDLGRVIWANDVLANAAREGARYASVRGAASFTPTATKDQIRAHTLGFGGGMVSAPVVTVCYSAVNIAQGSIGCTGNVDQSGATNARGNLVTVTITGQVQLVAGGLIGLGTFTVTGSSTVMINN